MAIRELDKEFFGKGDVSGYHFVQIMKNNDGYIYSVFEDNSPNILHYEVFQRKLVNQFDFKTKTELEDQKVRYPKAKDFGSWAWTFTDYYSALGKFRNIHKNKEKK